MQCTVKIIWVMARIPTMKLWCPRANITCGALQLWNLPNHAFRLCKPYNNYIFKGNAPVATIILLKPTKWSTFLVSLSQIILTKRRTKLKVMYFELVTAYKLLINIYDPRLISKQRRLLKSIFGSRVIRTLLLLIFSKFVKH